MKSIFQRTLTPALTLLIAALGTVTMMSVSRTQQRVEAGTCNQPCSGLSCGGTEPCPVCRASGTFHVCAPC
jgi:hypothetical protein